MCVIAHVPPGGSLLRGLLLRPYKTRQALSVVELQVERFRIQHPECLSCQKHAVLAARQSVSADAKLNPTPTGLWVVNHLAP